ncbi:alpha/beta hydrolase family esterase [Hydrogenimonas sp.]
MRPAGALLTLLALFCFLLLAGCRTDGPTRSGQSAGLFYETLPMDGTTRRYALYIPENLGNEPRPLVISLHGGGVRIEDMTGESGYKSPYKIWMEIAERERVMILYPEGLDGAYGKPTWNDCRGDSLVSSTADDVAFIEALIERVASSYPLDRSRIYASGTSNGGMMALRLGIERPSLFAAVAAVAAAMPARSECPTPSRPISVLFMNGTADTHMPYEGGTVSDPPKPEYGTVISTEESVAIFTRLDATEATPTRYRFADLDPDDGGVVVRFDYAGGAEGSEVMLYRVEGGGHSAPSIKERYSALFERYFGKQNHDIEMAEEVWRFFRTHRRGAS